MTDEEKIARNVFKVRLFIDAWEAIDPDVAMACLSDDIVYINQPLAPVIGQHDVRKIVAGIMKLSKGVHWELRNCFGRGNTVVTERLDCWDFDGRGWGDLPVGTGISWPVPYQELDSRSKPLYSGNLLSGPSTYGLGRGAGF